MSREIKSSSLKRGPKLILDYATNLEEACEVTKAVFRATEAALALEQANARTLGPYAPRDLMAGDPASPSGTKVELSELADDVLQALAAISVGSARTPFMEVDVTSALVSADDVFDIQTGAFAVAGPQSTFSSFSTPALPSTAAEFRDDTRVRIWFNGVRMSKGASSGDGRDVYYVSTTSVAFGFKIRSGDLVRVESLAAF